MEVDKTPFWNEMRIYKHASLHIYDLVINFPTNKETDTRKHLNKPLKSVVPSCHADIFVTWFSADHKSLGREMHHI